MRVTAGMAQGFYYPIYPDTLIGGGPEPWVYSPADQALSDQLADQRVKKFVASTTQEFARQGLLEPVRPMALPEENGSGDIVSVSA